MELGKLTRALYNAILTMRFDACLIGITKTDIPDSKERLNAIITKSEQAAHRTLSAVEELLPIVDTMAINAHKIVNLGCSLSGQRETDPARLVFTQRKRVSGTCRLLTGLVKPDTQSTIR